MDIIKTPEQKRWAVIQAIAAALFLFAYSFQYTNYYLWLNLSKSYLNIAEILFMGFQFYFIGIRCGKEHKCLFFFVLWVYFSRLIHGDFTLEKDLDFVWINCFALCLFPVAILLEPQQRKKLFCVIATCVGLYYTVVSVCCVWAAISNKVVGNPICPAINIAAFYSERLCVFERNPNVAAMWFFASICLLTYLFFTVKSVSLRAMALMCSLVVLSAISLTYCRNIMMAFSAFFSLLVTWFILKLIKQKCLALRVICFFMAVGILSVAAYSTTEKLRSTISSFGYIRQQAVHETVATRAQPQYSYVPLVREVENKHSAEAVPISWDRGFEDTGRLPIYRNAIKALLIQPKQLLLGELQESHMDTVNQLLIEEVGKPYDHPHNMFLFIILTTGIFGFLLLMVFLISVVIKILKLYFSDNPNVKAEHIVLCLGLVGMMMYNMLETSLFICLDMRSISFMLIAGAVVAYEKELCQ